MGKDFPVGDLNPGGLYGFKSKQAEWKQIHAIASKKNVPSIPAYSAIPQ